MEFLKNLLPGLSVNECLFFVIVSHECERYTKDLDKKGLKLTAVRSDLQNSTKQNNAQKQGKRTKNFVKMINYLF